MRTSPLSSSSSVCHCALIHLRTLSRLPNSLTQSTLNILLPILLLLRVILHWVLWIIILQVLGWYLNKILSSSGQNKVVENADCQEHSSCAIFPQSHYSQRNRKSHPDAAYRLFIHNPAGCKTSKAFFSCLRNVWPFCLSHAVCCYHLFSAGVCIVSGNRLQGANKAA